MSIEYADITTLLYAM